MRTFQEASPLSEPRGNEPIDRFTLSYMAGLARDRIHQVILNAFIESGISKADLARRAGMDKSRVSKILNTSSNITAETLGQILFAIDGSCPGVTRDWPLRERPANHREPEWFADCIDGARLHIRTTATHPQGTGHAAATSTRLNLLKTTQHSAQYHEHA